MNATTVSIALCMSELTNEGPTRALNRWKQVLLRAHALRFFPEEPTQLTLARAHQAHLTSTIQAMAPNHLNAQGPKRP